MEKKETYRTDTTYVEAGETNDYSLFIFPAHQRDRNNNSVKGIMESIKEQT